MKPLSEKTMNKGALCTWTTERRKDRTTYTSKDFNFPWKIDFTRVETKSNMHEAVVENEIELEFELLDRIKLQWLQETDVEKTKVMTKYIADRLLQLIEFCVPSEVEVTSPDSCLEVVDNAAYGPLIQEVNNLIISNNSSSSSSNNSNKIDFLGSMPVNLTRQSLNTVQNNDYYMAEKSDGVRYLLYVVRDPFNDTLIAVLLDRAKAVFKFKGSVEVGQSLGYGTVLDGELVMLLQHDLSYCCIKIIIFHSGVQLEVQRIRLPSFRHTVVGKGVAIEKVIQGATRPHSKCGTVAVCKQYREVHGHGR